MGYIKISKHLLREGFLRATSKYKFGLHDASLMFIITRKANGKHSIDPYLLRNKVIRYENEV